MKTIKNFLKKETVLAIAAVLALLSMSLVPPSMEYLDYVDFRTLGILLSLMIVMAGLRRTGFFDSVGRMLLLKAHRVWQLVLALLGLCFFFSMFITNDVALLTFVPFTLIVLKQCGRKELLIPIVAYETVAANLGSMLTPIGNPQNLYLYELIKCSAGEFVLLMLPLAGMAALLLAVSIFFYKSKKDELTIIRVMLTDAEKVPHLEDLQRDNSSNQNGNHRSRISARAKDIIFGVLFILAILVVVRLIPWYVVLGVIVTATLLIDRKTLISVDYALIFTFIAFFVLIGNLGRVPEIAEMLERMVSGREIITGTLLSQIISNVPAALLLSGFTNEYRMLALGVNIGGLGTLIASMASLISYKTLAHEENSMKGRYFLFFTALNLLFLAILLPFALLLY